MTPNNKNCENKQNPTRRISYGFYPQMKAECVCLKKEISASVIIGTNPGYQMGVVVVDVDLDHGRLFDTEDS